MSAPHNVLLLIGSPKPGESSSESLGTYLLDELEARFPGISHVKRDRGGAVVLSEVDDDGRVSDAAIWSDEERGS